MLEQGTYEITCNACGCTAAREEWNDDNERHSDDATEGISEVLAGDSVDLSVVGLGAGCEADFGDDQDDWL
jgi:hypothetical protein